MTPFYIIVIVSCILFVILNILNIFISLTYKFLRFYIIINGIERIRIYDFLTVETAGLALITWPPVGGAAAGRSLSVCVSTEHVVLDLFPPPFIARGE